MERRHAPEQCSQELLKQLTSQLRQSVDDARDVLREALEARTELTHQRNAATTSAEVRRSNDQASIELLGIAGASLSPIAAHEHVLNDVGTDAIFKLAERLSLPVERLGENLSLSNIQILVREGRKFSLEPHQADQLYRVAYVASLAADLFKSHKEAGEWLTSPQRSLGGSVPLVLLKTFPGTMLVLDTLARLKHGFYA